MAELRFLIAVALSVMLASGCMGLAGKVEDRYGDANRQFGKAFSGGEQTSHSVTIPQGTAQLTVKAAWDISGGAQLVLRNPAGVQAQSTQFGGAQSTADDEWFSVQDPLMGTWKLEVSAGGTGAYAFGFYYS